MQKFKSWNPWFARRVAERRYPLLALVRKQAMAGLYTNVSNAPVVRPLGYFEGIANTVGNLLS